MSGFVWLSLFLTWLTCPEERAGYIVFQAGAVVGWLPSVEVCSVHDAGSVAVDRQGRQWVAVKVEQGRVRWCASKIADNKQQRALPLC